MGFFMSKEQIPEAKIRQAIWMLKTNKTKKSVCEHLGIAYNVKKLEKIIEEFRIAEARELELRQKNKNTELSEQTKKTIATQYLNGTTQSELAKQFYISTARVKKVILEYGVPIRARAKKGVANTQHITQNLDIKFKVGERVFYAAENAFATITTVFDEEYAEYCRLGRQRWVELVPWTNKSIHSEPVQGIHYEIYYELQDASTWKLENLKSHIKRIEDLIADTGRETYAIQIEGEFSYKKLFVFRSDLFPVMCK